MLAYLVCWSCCCCRLHLISLSSPLPPFSLLPSPTHTHPAQAYTALLADQIGPDQRSLDVSSKAANIGEAVVAGRADDSADAKEPEYKGEEGIEGVQGERGRVYWRHEECREGCEDG